jgi:cytidylate kinase
MSIITISRGSYSRGCEVAEKVAEKLSYRCISRDMILEASKEFNIPEIKMVSAIEDAPSILDKIGSKKEKYMTFIQYAILREFQNDNVVYHGLAGHIFARGLKHALKVRIIADWFDRVQIIMSRDGINREQAIKILKKIDLQRLNWSQSLYGIDPGDPQHYDLVIHIQNLNVEDAVDLICHTVNLERFKKTHESQKELEARVETYRKIVEEKT